MSNDLKLITAVSRPEFLPANLGSLIMGISWAISPPLVFIWEFVALVLLCLFTLLLVQNIAAQLNTIYDYDFDSKDEQKKELVQAMGKLGRRKLKLVVIAEFLIGFVLVVSLFLIQGNPVLIFLFLAGSFLAYAYSVPPIRLKSRPWSQMIALFLALSILPVLFVFYSFSWQLNPIFLLFLAGQALTVYSLILPTEIRDYFIDSELGVKTMTVRLGLIKASFLSIALLSVGGAICVIAFFIELVSGLNPVFIISLLIIPIADLIVLRKYKRLYSLSKEYESSKGQSQIAQDITGLAAHNPQWITLVSQAIVVTSIILIVAKFLS
ncbi:MAG: prenyltransferase [Candidatus Hodarchaeota archaeon]